MTQAMLQVVDPLMISVRRQMLESLVIFRKDWEVAATGESLLNVEGSVGLILFDIATKFELSIEEQRVVFGSALFDELAHNMVYRESK